MKNLSKTFIENNWKIRIRNVSKGTLYLHHPSPGNAQLYL